MHKVLEEFADGEEQFDDITMLAFKYYGVKSDE
jgi:serine phosphatase RsbU (regulator of sigma subunit)